MQKIKSWNVINLLKTTTDYLRSKNIENPRLNAEQLLTHVLQMDRVSLYVAFERPVSENELAHYRELVSRRLKREPLQYILAESEFMGLPFNVNTSVLIPRPETEILVESVLALKKDEGLLHPNLLDIGTGSGCIPISIKHFWPECNVFGLDVSQAAIETAKQNQKKNNVEVSFLVKDLFSAWPDKQIAGPFDIVTSNPPYITAEELPGLEPEVKNFEPEIALTDYQDGMRFYIHLFNLIKSAKLHTRFLFVEMSGSQPEKIVTEAKKCKFSSVETIKDLNQIERVLKITV